MKAVATTVAKFPTSLGLRIVGILSFTLLTALGAQLKIPVPGTIVPVTLQTAFVLLAGLRLGARDGAISQALYLAGGLAGLPFFAAASTGTAGYLVGFIIAAAMAGALVGKTKDSFIATWALTFVASLLIFIPGVTYLKFFTQVSWGQAVMMGFVPFIIGDLLKVTLSATLFSLSNRLGFSQTRR